jgi:hypothetical protein
MLMTGGQNALKYGRPMEKFGLTNAKLLIGRPSRIFNAYFQRSRPVYDLFNLCFDVDQMNREDMTVQRRLGKLIRNRRLVE